MTTRDRRKVVNIDDSLFRDIANLQREIEKKTACALSFRRASKLYVQANTHKTLDVKVDGVSIRIERK